MAHRNPSADMFLGRYIFPAFGIILITWALGLAALPKQRIMKAVIILAFLYCGVWSMHKEYTLTEDPGYQQYLALGGRKLSYGSDAHRPEHVGFGFETLPDYEAMRL